MDKKSAIFRASSDYYAYPSDGRQNPSAPVAVREGFDASQEGKNATFLGPCAYPILGPF